MTTPTSKTIIQFLGNNNSNKTKSYSDAGINRICYQYCPIFSLFFSLSPFFLFLLSFILQLYKQTFYRRFKLF